MVILEILEVGVGKGRINFSPSRHIYFYIRADNICVKIQGETRPIISKKIPVHR
jgi:hypothetical protein